MIMIVYPECQILVMHTTPAPPPKKRSKHLWYKEQ